jgi:cobalt-precorrin 5A hydrolase/precorrin-3B C17-methyltransferase
VVSVADDGSVVVPLLGGHRGANRLARKIAEALDSTAAVTTAGDVSLGVSLDEPPEGWALANPQDAKGAMAALLSGGGAALLGAEAAQATWLADMPAGDAVKLSCDMTPAKRFGPPSPAICAEARDHRGGLRTRLPATGIGRFGAYGPQ